MMTRDNAASRGARDLLVWKEAPLNAEPPLEGLVDSWTTPVERFYVRNHAPTPVIDPAEWELAVEGWVERPLRLSLEELNGRFPAASATVTMQCAGLRRREHSATRPVPGIPWDAGAVGNARWDGVRLADVLTAAGVRDGARHVWFEGLDEAEIGGGRTTFGASIPLAKAVAPETLIATAMNGGPLTPDHGAPVRTVVPGFIGARSVKWLGRVVVADRPSDNHYVARAYKVAPPEADADTVDWASIAPLGELPINAVVCVPAAGATLPAGAIRVRGWAIAPGAVDRTIERVQVSSDSGCTWTNAELEGERRPFAWTLWEARIDLAAGEREVVVRAWDSSGAIQPETTPWNFKGYAYNGWHRVQVTVVAGPP